MRTPEATSIVLSPTQPTVLADANILLPYFMSGKTVSRDEGVTFEAAGVKLEYVVASYLPPSRRVKIVPTTTFTINSKVARSVNLGKRIKKVGFTDIGGLTEQVRKVREMIELPLKHPEVFERLGQEPPKGVLLHGPPGTGKTLIAKAVANESGAAFFTIQGPEIMSKFYGESEERLRDLFKKAETEAPSVIFIDELDSIAPIRDDVRGEAEVRVVAQLLTLMDGIESRGRVVVIGATNRVKAIDPALRRPGRFDRELKIDLPNESDRAAILAIHTRGMAIGGDLDFTGLASQTEGFAGADIEALCREASMRALRRFTQLIESPDAVKQKDLLKITVTGSDFQEALDEMQGKQVGKEAKSTWEMG